MPRVPYERYPLRLLAFIFAGYFDSVYFARDQLAILDSIDEFFDWMSFSACGLHVRCPVF
jgi:hypothetical protein